MNRVQHEDFDVGQEVRAHYKPGTGAVVSFVGLVRDYAQGAAVSAIELEYYPGMTEKLLTDIEAEAFSRWPLLQVTIIHRVGKLEAHEQIVLVVVSSAHRQAAFEAAAFLMDYLKIRAPFWKKEWVNGEPHWVEAKTSDAEAADRWSGSKP